LATLIPLLKRDKKLKGGKVRAGTGHPIFLIKCKGGTRSVLTNCIWINVFSSVQMRNMVLGVPFLPRID
jgi:hypothetical protein